jgi:hypothetical protein
VGVEVDVDGVRDRREGAARSRGVVLLPVVLARDRLAPPTIRARRTIALMTETTSATIAIQGGRRDELLRRRVAMLRQCRHVAARINCPFRPTCDDAEPTVCI